METRNTNFFTKIKIASMFFILLWVGSACEKDLSHAEKDMLIRKTDSVVNLEISYQLSQNAYDLGSQRLKAFRDANKMIAIRSAMDFIEKNISDGVSRELMFDELYSSLDSCYVDYDEERCVKISDIYSENRWFNDLMLYLTGVYTDAQFLNSVFFSVIKDSAVHAKFIYNTEKMVVYNNVSNVASKQRSKIYTRTFNQCVSEYKQRKKS